MISSLIGMGTVLAVLLGSIGLLHILKSPLNLSAEVTRKAVHILMGICCISFPWIFENAWPVILLCTLSLTALAWLRIQSGELKTVLHGVSRLSYGELCFPLAVAILFILMENPIIDYAVPVLVLSLADAVGALIGVRYGRSPFTTDEGFKSLEGSLAFLITAFFSTHVPLLLFTNIGREESLLIGLLVGLLVMLLEAIAWRGLDNLFIPIGTYLCLQVYHQLNAEDLMTRLGVLIAMMLLFWLVRKHTYARDGTTLASVLLLYLIWVVGGWYWILPPLAVQIGYMLLCPSEFRKTQIRHSLADLGAVAGVGFIWLFLSVIFPGINLYWAFAFSWAAQLSMIAGAYLTWSRPNIKTSRAVTWAAIFSGLIFMIPVYLSDRFNHLIQILPLLLGATCISASLLWKREWLRHRSTVAPGRAWRQFIYGAGASTLGCLLIHLP